MKNIKLSKGYRERIWAWIGVSPQRGGNTMKDLARAMAKTWSKTQMVTGGHVGWIIWGLNYKQVFLDWRLRGMSKIV